MCFKGLYLISTGFFLPFGPYSVKNTIIMSDNKKITYGLIASAGMGKRMGKGEGAGVKKNYIVAGGKPLLYYVLKSFENAEKIDKIIVGVLEEDIAYCKEEIVEKFGFKKVEAVISGGVMRQDTVEKMLTLTGGDCGVVVVHDGARPMVSAELIDQTIGAALKSGAVITAVAVKDTIKRKSADNNGAKVVATLNRDELVSVQTPQAFKKDILADAFKKAKEKHLTGTDEAMLVERAGYGVNIIEGDYKNIKVTTPEDVLVVESFLKVK